MVHSQQAALTANQSPVDGLIVPDAERRLVAIETRPDLPAAVPRLRLEFAYDSQSRRISKKVFSWDAITSAFSLQLSSLLVYDGWLLLAEVDATGAAVRSYVWGLDFSGTLQGAGGIGGLLCVNVGGAAPAAMLPCYDGNGNVVGLVDSGTGDVSGSVPFSQYRLDASTLRSAWGCRNHLRSGFRYPKAILTVPRPPRLLLLPLGRLQGIGRTPFRNGGRTVEGRQRDLRTAACRSFANFRRKLRPWQRCVTWYTLGCSWFRGPRPMAIMPPPSSLRAAVPCSAPGPGTPCWVAIGGTEIRSTRLPGVSGPENAM